MLVVDTAARIVRIWTHPDDSARAGNCARYYRVLVGERPWFLGWAGDEYLEARTTLHPWQNIRNPLFEGYPSKTAKSNVALQQYRMDDVTDEWSNILEAARACV